MHKDLRVSRFLEISGKQGKRRKNNQFAKNIFSISHKLLSAKKSLRNISILQIMH